MLPLLLRPATASSPHPPPCHDRRIRRRRTRSFSTIRHRRPPPPAPVLRLDHAAFFSAPSPSARFAMAGRQRPEPCRRFSPTADGLDDSAPAGLGRRLLCVCCGRFHAQWAASIAYKREDVYMVGQGGWSDSSLISIHCRMRATATPTRWHGLWRAARMLRLLERCRSSELGLQLPPDRLYDALSRVLRLERDGGPQLQSRVRIGDEQSGMLAAEWKPWRREPGEDAPSLQRRVWRVRPAVELDLGRTDARFSACCVCSPTNQPRDTRSRHLSVHLRLPVVTDKVSRRPPPSRRPLPGPIRAHSCTKCHLPTNISHTSRMFDLLRLPSNVRHTCRDTQWASLVISATANASASLALACGASTPSRKSYCRWSPPPPPQEPYP